MSYLLDTCIVSEFIKEKPDTHLIRWLNSRDSKDLFLSVISIGELRKGIVKLSDSNLRKKKLATWLAEELLPYFQNRILSVDQIVMENWGEINGLAEKRGKKIPALDSLIGAIAYTHQLTLVTRNIKDFQQCQVQCENPWQTK